MYTLVKLSLPSVFDLPLKLFISISCLCISHGVVAQKRCATVEHQQKLFHNHGINEREIDFEQWLQGKRLQRLKRKSGIEIKSVYQIPVVVHIIHNGEPIGTGTNIPKEQVLSQISVLNEDFNRLNADAIQTPPEFAAVAGSMNIEFVLAKRTPEGLPTDGIVRVQGNRTSWTEAHDTQLKATSYWPSEDYLNIWVCNLTDYLGYAQFPVSNLPGLQAYQDGIALTDGAVFSYKVFGSIVHDATFNLDSQYNRGRTATHEIGHFFGLRHIWGDNLNCTGTDYIDDTPNQRVETYNAPTHPRGDVCSPVIMFQNFLDYTDDIAMNLFTQDQVDRMITVLENSPRRSSLLTSPGLLEPTPQGNDMALLSVMNPSPVQCESTFMPKLNVQNVGATLISSFKINYGIDDGPLATVNFNSINLTTGEATTVTLPAITLSEGEHTLFFEIDLPNGFDDTNTANNNIAYTMVINVQEDLPPLRENFEKPLSDSWTSVNTSGEMAWSVVHTGVTQALHFNAFNNVIPNNEAWFVTPVLNFSNLQAASLFFDVSYAYRAGGDDRLRVLLSVDCGATYPEVLFNDVGPSLSNGRTSNTSWKPAGDNDWSEKYINLSAFAGEPNVRIAFVVTNDNGNNLYLDNIEFFLSEDPEPDVTDKYFVAYPNPVVDGKITVTMTLPERQPAVIELIDAVGRVTFRQEIPYALNQSIPIDLQAAYPGVYFLRFTTPTRTIIRKIIVIQ